MLALGCPRTHRDLLAFSYNVFKADHYALNDYPVEDYLRSSAILSFLYSFV